jgi:hypothetical protein
MAKVSEALPMALHIEVTIHRRAMLPGEREHMPLGGYAGADRTLTCVKFGITSFVAAPERFADFTIIPPCRM